jgi:elongation factor Ts
MITLQEIKKLRVKTGAGLHDAKDALEKAKGDASKAEEILRKKGLIKVGKRKDRATSAGRVEIYLHGEPPTVGAMVELLCETDFVAKTSEFATLGRELAMQVASMNPDSLDDLLNQEYIRDPKKYVKDLIHDASAKFGERIEIGRFIRYKVGDGSTSS